MIEFPPQVDEEDYCEEDIWAYDRSEIATSENPCRPMTEFPPKVEGTPEYYTSEQISNKFEKLTKNKKIQVLYDAIDYMQSYNGRSRFLCIAMAMGYDNYEGRNDTYMKR